ncbi:MAG: DUF4234 domain-containing protein [Actinomycetota bacterium]|nr:DUF4234 domain-containing protein [Actinomycetota bacterium]
MAERVRVRGVAVKIRNPWLAFLWAILTFGIYYLVWYYKVNRELRDFGRASGTDLGESPFVSLLAITIGWLVIVPPFISMFATFGRVRQAQAAAGVEERVEPWLGFALFVVALYLLPVEIPYAQHHLNRVWSGEGAPGRTGAVV